MFLQKCAFEVFASSHIIMRKYHLEMSIGYLKYFYNEDTKLVMLMLNQWQRFFQISHFHF